MRHLSLSLLNTFKTIAECNSLTLAAQRLHKTPAAISIQLKKLEAQTGKKLIERGFQNAQLTSDGEVLLQYARRLLALSEEAFDTINTPEISGTVRFGIPDDFASAFLHATLQRFAQRYPGVRLEIRNDISLNLFTGLESGELDMALVTQRQGDNGAEVLRRDPLLWVAEANYKFNSSAPLPLALYPQGCDFRKCILSSLSEAQRDYYIAFECTGVTGVRIAVDSGLAIAATCDPLIQPNWKILDLEALELPALGTVAIELRLGRDEPSPAIKCFADELREQVILPSNRGYGFKRLLRTQSPPVS